MAAINVSVVIARIDGNDQGGAVMARRRRWRRGEAAVLTGCRQGNAKGRPRLSSGPELVGDTGIEPVTSSV